MCSLKKRQNILPCLIFVGIPLLAFFTYLFLLIFVYFTADERYQNGLILTVSLLSIAFSFLDLSTCMLPNKDLTPPVSRPSAGFLSLSLTLFALLFFSLFSCFLCPRSIDYIINCKDLPNVLAFLALMLFFLLTAVSNIRYCKSK